MSSTSTKIFVVDDDPVGRMVAISRLTETTRYDIREFDDAVSLLAAMDDEPDIVLLDIEMPGMNGIDACRALRAAGHDHAIVLFVSSNDDLDTRLAAYQAGGCDYIIKPYVPEDLVQKVQVAEKYLARNDTLAQQASLASRTAFTAMSSMGEMGTLLEFLRNSFACEDMDSLANAVFRTLRQYGLNGLLGIRSVQGPLCRSSQGECMPLECSILEHAQHMGRIFQFSDRMAINFPDVTLLVLGLPLAESDRLGRLRDHLATLTEGVQSRVAVLQASLRRRAQATGISQAVEGLTRALVEIEQRLASNRVAAMEIHSDYLQRLTNAFVSLGLSEDQESALARMAEQSYARLESLTDEGQFVGSRLHEISAQLAKLIEG